MSEKIDVAGSRTRMGAAGRLGPPGLVLAALAALGPLAPAQEMMVWGALNSSARHVAGDCVQVAIGGSHLLARRSDGVIEASGSNRSGQCDVPTLPTGLGYWGSAAAGDYSAALRTDGALVDWGYWSGRVPALPPNTAYMAVAAGGQDFFGWTFHVLALRTDGNVVAWGSNGSGECNVPPLPAGLGYTSVAAGGFNSYNPGSYGHSAACRSDGTVVVWGDSSHGQQAVPLLPGGMQYQAVGANADGFVALRSDGNIVAWGANQWGTCNVPALPGNLTYVEIAAGPGHVLARRSDGSVVAWGSNGSGECDVPILPNGVTFLGIAASGAFNLGLGTIVSNGCSAAICSDGRVLQWGRGIRPPSSSTTAAVPIAVSAGGGNSGLSPGPGASYSGSTVVELRGDGSMTAWGVDGEGEPYAPTVPVVPAGLVCTRIQSGFGLITSILSDGTALGWGWTAGSMLSNVVPVLPPGRSFLRLVPGGSPAIFVGGEMNFTMALCSDGTLVGGYPWWGPNPPGSNFVDVACGYSFVMVLDSSGAITMWLPALVPGPAPALPPGLRYVAIAAGTAHALALRSDGTIEAWGDNSVGQCNVPALPPGVVYVEISAGRDWHAPGFSVARRSDGHVVAWGNGWGVVPTLPAGMCYSQISAGYDTTAALYQSGSYETFAAGCAGSQPAATVTNLHLPRLGQSMLVRFDHLPQSAAIVCVGFSNLNSGSVPLPVDLAPFGMPNCRLQVSPDFLQPIAGFGGSLTHSLPIPNLPGLAGFVFHQQALVLDSAAGNAAGAVMSAAATAVVGP